MSPPLLGYLSSASFAAFMLGEPIPQRRLSLMRIVRLGGAMATFLRAFSVMIRCGGIVRW